MDPRRRGEYQGAAELTGTLGRVWAPGLYTFLAMTWGSVGWLIIGAIAVVAAAGLHPATALAQRFLARLGPLPANDDPLSAAAPPVPPPSLLEDPPMSPSGDGFGPPTAHHH